MLIRRVFPTLDFPYLVVFDEKLSLLLSFAISSILSLLLFLIVSTLLSHSLFIVVMIFCKIDVGSWFTYLVGHELWGVLVEFVKFYY